MSPFKIKWKYDCHLGVHFNYTKKPCNTQMGCFWSPLALYRIYLTNIKSGTSHKMHPTPHIPYCIWICKLQNFMDQNRVGLQQFIKTDPEWVNITFLG